MGDMAKKSTKSLEEYATHVKSLSRILSWLSGKPAPCPIGGVR